MTLPIGLRRHAGQRLEQAVEMRWAQPGIGGERGQIGQCLGAFEPAAGSDHRRSLPLFARNLVRLAAFAGAIARRLGRIRAREEPHAIAPWPPGGAGRAAIDARARHCIK